MAGSVVHAQSQSIIPLAASGTSNLPPKATGESEKRLALPKSVVETRKAGRRLVRPRLVKQDEPQGDVEMSETEGLGGKPGPSSDTETQSNLALSSQPLARKRVAPTSSSELREESVAPGDKSSEPLVKKSRGVESQEETGEEPPAATSEFSGSHPATEESFESGELPQGQNEELGDAQNDDGETAVSKDEESKDPQQFDGTTSQEELQGDKTGISEENPDQSAEAKILSDEMQMDHPEPDNQQPGSDREEGEMLPETGDPEGEPQESREGPSDPVASPEPSPARVDDEGLEAGEINSPELSSEDKNDEGDLVEEAADGLDKVIDVNETTSVESDPVAEPAPVASESTLTSGAAESSSSKSNLPVPKQGTTGTPSETGESRQASPINPSTTINLQERARQRAQLRQAGQERATSATPRGRGRPNIRGGRIVRGRGGRRPPPPADP